MKQIILTLSIFATFIMLVSPLRSETICAPINSAVNISHAMDVLIKSNSLNYLSVQDTISNDITDNKTAVSKPAKSKSPATALVIALVPGAVVHGAGHFYAGKTKTAIGLFGAEIIGGVLVFFGALGSSLQSDTEGESGSNAGPIVLFLGLGLLVGSWIYDIAESPAVISRQNDQTPEKKPFPHDLDLQLEKDNQQIKCLLVKHF